MDASSLFPCLTSDLLDPDELAERLFRWVHENKSFPVTFEVADTYFNTIAPRSIFLKTLPLNSRLLDMGAGNGSLSVYKEWPMIARPDLRMYAVSLEWGERFDRYDDVQIGNFESDQLDFPNIQFDGVVCAHFIEHMHTLDKIMDFLMQRLVRGGRIYFEWPHESSKRLPTNDRFKAAGLPVMVSNFFDDKTHQQTWPMQTVIDGLLARGLHIEAVGRTYFPYLADLMKGRASQQNNIVAGTLAVWYKTGFGQYLVAGKPG